MKSSKVDGHTYCTTNADLVIVNEPRINEEFAGRGNVDMPPVSVGCMRHPCGWVEPVHTLEFDGCAVVLWGARTVERGDGGG